MPSTKKDKQNSQEKKVHLDTHSSFDSSQHPSTQASARHTEVGDRFNKTLFAALDSLEQAGVAHAIIGGVAAIGLGRPRSTHDIDIFIRPEDASFALKALAQNGFDTERTDDTWLYKAWREDILVDLIFKSFRDIYFDDEMNEHRAFVPYHGRLIPSVGAEDFIIIKCAVNSEVGPHHWYDALSVLSTSQIDWKYLLARSKRAARRLLSLLIYAQSNDILIPNYVIFELYDKVFGTAKTQTQPRERSMAERKLELSPDPLKKSEKFLTQKIKDALDKDLEIGHQDIKVFLDNHKLVLKGEVNTNHQRELIGEISQNMAPDLDIDNEIQVVELSSVLTEEVVS